MSISIYSVEISGSLNVIGTRLMSLLDRWNGEISVIPDSWDNLATLTWTRRR